MAIQAPKWRPDAIPTKKGWEHPETGEVLKSANHSIADIQEWHASKASAPQMLNEAPSVERHITQSESSHFGFKTTH